MGCGGGQYLHWCPVAEEGVDLADAALDGQGGGDRTPVVGQPRLERAPDALDRIVVEAVARAVQHPKAGMRLQPLLDAGPRRSLVMSGSSAGDSEGGEGPGRVAGVVT